MDQQLWLFRSFLCREPDQQEADLLEKCPDGRLGLLRQVTLTNMTLGPFVTMFWKRRNLLPSLVRSVVVPVNKIAPLALLPVIGVVTILRIPHIHKGVIDQGESEFPRSAAITRNDLSSYDDITELPKRDLSKLPVQL